MIRTELAAAVVGLALSGCSQDAPAVGAAVQLSQCIEGWWQDPAPSACSCPGGAQCDAEDCAARRMIGFTADHTSYTGIVHMSERAQSAVPNGTLSEGSWRVEDGAIRIQPAKAQAYSAEASCNENELVFNHVVKVRAPTWLSTQLDAAAAEKGGR